MRLRDSSPFLSPALGFEAHTTTPSLCGAEGQTQVIMLLTHMHMCACAHVYMHTHTHPILQSPAVNTHDKMLMK